MFNFRNSIILGKNIMENFSQAELLKQKSIDFKKIKKTNKNKYITKIVNGERHLILNPDYTFKHSN